jgi:hypothetical protein
MVAHARRGAATQQRSHSWCHLHWGSGRSIPELHAIVPLHASKPHIWGCSSNAASSKQPLFEPASNHRPIHPHTLHAWLFGPLIGRPSKQPSAPLEEARSMLCTHLSAECLAPYHHHRHHHLLSTRLASWRSSRLTSHHLFVWMHPESRLRESRLSPSFTFNLIGATQHWAHFNPLVPPPGKYRHLINGFLFFYSGFFLSCFGATTSISSVTTFRHIWEF